MTTVFPGSGILPSGTPSLSPAAPAEPRGTELEPPPSEAAGSTNDLSAVITALAAYGDGQDEGTARSWLDQVIGPLSA
jgi:hypothetical protein